MSQEQIQQLIDQLLKTGEFLATEAYRIALQKVQADFWMAVIFSAIFLVMVIAGGSLLKTANKKADESEDYQKDDPDDFWEFYVGLAFITFGTILGIINLTNALQYGLSPEWYAVKRLLELAGL